MAITWHLNYTKYHDFSYVQTLITKIRSVEDYSQDKPVIVVGTQINDSTNGMGSLIGDTFTVGGKADTNLGYNSLLYLMSDYLGFSPYYGTYEEIQNWMQREVVREMPSYPADGSIQVIDDTIIVKLSDYEIKLRNELDEKSYLYLMKSTSYIKNILIFYATDFQWKSDRPA